MLQTHWAINYIQIQYLLFSDTFWIQFDTFKNISIINVLIISIVLSIEKMTV